MDRSEVAEHLSLMTTSWSALFRAHGEHADLATSARGELLARYGTPIYRYLLGATRDRDRADDLFQDFAVKFLRGDFRRADPERGRFRDFLRTALSRMVTDEFARRRPLPLTVDVAEPTPPPPDLDGAFHAIWREELMHRAWGALEAEGRRTGQPHFAVLRFRADHPDLKSPEMADRLGAALGRSVSAEWVRKWVHLARKRFAALLVEDVARSLADPTPERIEDELRDLGLPDVYREARGVP